MSTVTFDTAWFNLPVMGLCTDFAMYFVIRFSFYFPLFIWLYAGEVFTIYLANPLEMRFNVSLRSLFDFHPAFFSSFFVSFMSFYLPVN